MSSKVSIVVPIYKVPEDMLRKCIESCINQTLEDIEIILVDDESPDNCGKICDTYADKDNRIKVVHQKNKGLSGARNSGVNNASSEWIMFLDGDDYIDENMCEELISITADDRIEIVCCSYYRESKTVIKPCELKEIKEGVYIEEQCKFLQEKVLDFNANFSTAYCKLIKREYLIRNNIFHNEELRQGAEGIEFNIRLFEKAKAVFVMNKCFYHYIYNSESISNKHDEKNHKYVLNCFEIIKQHILQSKNKDRLLELLYNRLIYVIVTTAISRIF